jgi:hypothetical protein
MLSGTYICVSFRHGAWHGKVARVAGQGPRFQVKARKIDSRGENGQDVKFQLPLSMEGNA